MRRIGTWAAAAMLGASLLTGCGGNDTEAYCDAVKKAKKDFSALDDNDAGALEDFVKTAENLEEKAPEEVADDWKKVNDSFQELESKLNEAGVKISDLDEIQQGQIPEGVDQEKLIAVGEDMGTIGEDLEKSGDAITKHAKDECKVDLEAS